MPHATGHVVRRTPDDVELVLTRTFDATAADVWASLTDPGRPAGWLGPWRGEAGVGRTVELRMSFEEGDAWSTVHIDVCEPEERLRVTVSDEGQEEDWVLEARLDESAGKTELTFVHVLADAAVAESSGPGWEYYLDMLVASRAGVPLPDWDDYYPAQVAHYAAEVARVSKG